MNEGGKKRPFWVSECILTVNVVCKDCPQVGFRTKLHSLTYDQSSFARSHVLSNLQVTHTNIN